VEDLEVSPKPFWIWKHIHVHKVHVYEVYPREVRARAAQGGVTLGPEQGELGANFCHLGKRGGLSQRFLKAISLGSL
jgi:hypothetical protein